MNPGNGSTAWWQYGLIAVLVAAMIVDGLGMQLLSLVSPLMMADLGIDKAAFGPAKSAALGGMSADAVRGFDAMLYFNRAALCGAVGGGFLITAIGSRRLLPCVAVVTGGDAALLLLGPGGAVTYLRRGRVKSGCQSSCARAIR